MSLQHFMPPGMKSLPPPCELPAATGAAQAEIPQKPSSEPAAPLGSCRRTSKLGRCHFSTQVSFCWSTQQMTCCVTFCIAAQFCSQRCADQQKQGNKSSREAFRAEAHVHFCCETPYKFPEQLWHT